MTYHMELHRPKEEKTPFVCQLTFTAAGGMHGDIVQVRSIYQIAVVHILDKVFMYFIIF